MYNYYFKIKKNNIEFEFSTDNLEDFDLKVLNWVNNICNTKKDNEGNLQHQNFIDLKSNFSLTSQTKTHNIFPQESINESNINFEEVLNESIQNPKTKIKEVQADKAAFIQFLSSKHPKNTIDYLVLTAYYFKYILDTSNFSIKMINGKIFPITNEIVDHLIINQALNLNLIEAINQSDTTNNNIVTMYTITKSGENLFENDFK